MRPIGTLDCHDCGGRHEVQRTRCGHLVTLVTCPAASQGSPRRLAQRQLKDRLAAARRRLSRAEQLFSGESVNYAELVAQLDEIHRELVLAQSAIDVQLANS